MNIINYYINPKKKFIGEDSNLNVCWLQNFIPICFYFESKVPNLKDRIYSVSRKLLDNPKSSYRLVRLENKKQFNYNNAPTEELLPKLIHKIKKYNYNQIIKIAVDSGLSGIICWNDNLFCFCGNHLFFDGIGSYNVLQKYLDENHYIPLRKFTYIPILTEARYICNIKKNIKYITNIKSHIRYSPDWKETNSNADIHYLREQLHEFKKIKQNISTKVGINIPFAIIFAAIACNSFFKSNLKINKLTIGIIIGMGPGGMGNIKKTPVNIEEKGKKHFNNFSIIPIEVDRNTSNAGLIKLVNYIYIKAKKNKSIATSYYIASNIYNIRFKSMKVDMVISGIPMTKNYDITLNNVILKEVHIHHNYSSFPIYCGYLGCSRFLHINICTRTPDVKSRMISQNITKIMQNYKY